MKNRTTKSLIDRFSIEEDLSHGSHAISSYVSSKRDWALSRRPARLARGVIGPEKSYLRQEPPFVRGGESGSKRVSCGRTLYYATAFFLLLFPRAQIHSRISETRACVRDYLGCKCQRDLPHVAGDYYVRMRDYLEMQICRRLRARRAT